MDHVIAGNGAGSQSVRLVVDLIPEIENVGRNAFSFIFIDGQNGDLVAGHPLIAGQFIGIGNDQPCFGILPDVGFLRRGQQIVDRHHDGPYFRQGE
jgi:hypothetical protein